MVMNTFVPYEVTDKEKYLLYAEIKEPELQNNS